MLIGVTDMRRLSMRLGLGRTGGGSPIFEDNEGLVENLAHEVGHALSLGLLPSRGVETAIHVSLGNLSKCCQSREEALVLAAEAVVLPRLGIHFEEHAPGMTLRAAAEVQGVPNQLFWRAFGSSTARELGMRVLHYLLRWVREGRPRQRRLHESRSRLQSVGGALQGPAESARASGRGLQAACEWQCGGLIVMIICVWHENQLVPARLYGEANHPGKYELRVCTNPTVVVAEIQSRGGEAVVYHFSGSGGGGGWRS